MSLSRPSELLLKNVWESPLYLILSFFFGLRLPNKLDLDPLVFFPSMLFFLKIDISPPLRPSVFVRC